MRESQSSADDAAATLTRIKKSDDEGRKPFELNSVKTTLAVPVGNVPLPVTKHVPSEAKMLSEDDSIVISEKCIPTRLTGNESSSDMLTPSMGQTQDFSMTLDPSRNITDNGTGVGIMNDSKIISTNNSVMKTKAKNDVSPISEKAVISENFMLKHCESDDKPDDLVNLDKSTINELKVSTCFLF